MEITMKKHAIEGQGPWYIQQIIDREQRLLTHYKPFIFNREKSDGPDSTNGWATPKFLISQEKDNAT